MKYTSFQYRISCCGITEVRDGVLNALELRQIQVQIPVVEECGVMEDPDGISDCRKVTEDASGASIIVAMKLVKFRTAYQLG
jgi:hypothetical protein